MAAQDNIQICYPSTPAQMFHLLRRQVIRPYRKPLIIFSPKSTLRRKLSFSPLTDLAQGGFRAVIGESEIQDPNSIDRLVFCSGKVHFDILEARREKDIRGVGLARIEQLYPYPDEAIRAELARYPRLTAVVWAQEEPENQGAWYFLRDRLQAALKAGQVLSYAGRPNMAAPSGGDYHRHLERQKIIVETALDVRDQVQSAAQAAKK
jgi:2-oxoglutarate dehydrogenase E1 component